MINKVTLLGHAGKDAEAKQGKTGAFAVFSLATGTKEKTQWHNVIVTGQQAAMALDMIKKGSLVYLEGGISYTKQEDKHFTNIFSNFFRVLNKGASGGQEAKQAQAKAVDSSGNSEGGFEDDDIPF